MTESAKQALLILRDPAQFQWYVIPLMTLASLVYADEIKKKNWNAVSAGLTYLGLDLFIEIVNSLIFHITDYAPVWGTPGKTAFLILIGMNIEIFFMFALVGIVMSRFLPDNKNATIAGIPGRFAVAAGAGIFCGAAEVVMNSTGVLVWEYPWWNSGASSILIVLGYFMFFRISFFVFDLDDIKKKFFAVGAIFTLDASCIIVFGIILKWI